MSYHDDNNYTVPPDNFKVILPARSKYDESSAPDYRTWETEKVQFELSLAPPNYLTWRKKVQKPLQVKKTANFINLANIE